MTDFISQSKLPGVLLAKFIGSKVNFDQLLKQDEKFRKELTDIGYLVKLDPTNKKDISEELESELKTISGLKEEIVHKADIFAKTLGDIIKISAEKSSYDTKIVYNLTQVIFLWDEFIDFEDYQKSKGDLSKIRESAFYRGACSVMQDIFSEDLKKLEDLDLKTQNFEKALYQLQVLNGDEKFTPEKYYFIIENLKKSGLSNPDIVFFLLLLEAALFIHIVENLLSKADKEDVKVFQEIDDVQTSIQKVSEIFHLTPDQIENMLDSESQILLLKLDKEILL